MSSHSIIDNQQIFNVYMHSAHPEHVDCNSIFAKYQIPERAFTQNGYLQFATVSGVLALLKTALRDEENRVFVMLSDASIPLYHPVLLYMQLLSLPKPLISSCHHNNMNYERHNGFVFTKYFRRHHWRKSMAWFVLQRNWAQFVIDDMHVIEIFKRWCFYCIADEHYIASLFASYHLDNQTLCIQDSHYQDWSRKPGTHPHTFRPEEINASLLPVLRRHECGSMLLKSLDSALDIIAAPSHEQPLTEQYVAKSPECPLFARKFSNDSQQLILDVVSQCANASSPFLC
jgi:hypothetical protein